MWVLQLPCFPTIALVLLFNPSLGVLIRKNLSGWMLQSPWGDSFLRSCLWQAGPCPGVAGV